MKTMKKLLALTLALAMVLSLAVSAFAATGEKTITIENTVDGYTYVAYQIFAGDIEQAEGSNKVLTNLKWGSDVNTAALFADEEFVTLFGENPSAEDVANILKNYSNDSAQLDTFSRIVGTYVTGGKANETHVSGQNYAIKVPAEGYYLVKNTNVPDENSAYTKFILKVVEDLTVTPKSSYPELHKKIQHNDDDETWGVVGDNQIGDEVFFRTESTITSRIAEYLDTESTYQYIIHDAMSAHLTPNVVAGNTNGNVKVKVNDSTELSSEYITVTMGKEDDCKVDCTFHIAIDVKAAITAGDLKVSDKLYTYYSATLNDTAIIYDQGNQENTAYLEYSNNPYDNEATGKTPEETVYDWTFKMAVHKIDEQSEDGLEGALFILSDTELTTVPTYDDATETLSSEAGLIKLIKTDNGYRVATATETGTTCIIEAGEPVITGLDDETTYYLYEVKAPAGYNLKTDATTFKVSANDHYSTDGSTITAEDVTLTVNGDEQSEDNLTVTIGNNSGLELPSTGGIGTTIFYLVGGLLSVGAVILLITKKKMSAI